MIDKDEPDWLTRSNFTSPDQYHSTRRRFYLQLAAVIASPHGSKRFLALQCGLNPRSLDTMTYAGKAVSEAVALRIEEITRGRVRAEDIRSGCPHSNTKAMKTT